MKRWAGMMVVGLATLASAAERASPILEWGGILAEGRTQGLRLQAGLVTEFKGGVTETTRRLYEVTGAVESQARAQSYDISDFDLKGPFGAAGLALDMHWKFVRLRLDTMFLAPSVRTTARRDYYLGVHDNIAYQGRHYDHMMIPDGTEFSAEVIGNVSEVVLSLVPVGLRIGDSVVVNPSLDAGLLLFGGQYEIDAGPVTGLTRYQNPPEDFVVGGKASGLVGMGAPEWGPSLAVRVEQPNGVAWDVSVSYLFLHYRGSTSLFTTSSHREKDLDFKHRNVRVRGQVEIPWREMAWVVGVQAQVVDSKGVIESSARTDEEVLARRERFDKEFKFGVESIYLSVGLLF